MIRWTDSRSKRALPMERTTCSCHEDGKCERWYLRLPKFGLQRFSVQPRVTLHAPASKFFFLSLTRGIHGLSHALLVTGSLGFKSIQVAPPPSTPSLTTTTRAYDMPSEEPRRGLSCKLVLSFDVGATYSGVSYCILDPGSVPKVLGVLRRARRCRELCSTYR